jgi:hypothetical protein
VTTLNTMVKQCAGLIDTRDVSDWESEFLQSIVDKTSGGDDTRSLTEKQITVLERIWGKHFAG